MDGVGGYDNFLYLQFWVVGVNFYGCFGFGNVFLEGVEEMLEEVGVYGFVLVGLGLERG